jgi:signal transduction histidine kinase
VFDQLMARIALIFLALLVWPSALLGQELSSYTTTATAAGPVIEFTSGEYALAEGIAPPTTGWQPAPNPHIIRIRETDWQTGDFHIMAGRFRFDRSALGAEPLALYTVSTRNQFAVIVNGREVGRNFARHSDQVLAWYRPYLVALPAGSLVPGTNTIEIRVSSQDSVGIGRIIIGPDSEVRANYQTQYFWQITAPLAASFAMLIMGILAFLFWLGRRQEVELAWLSASTILWFLRNYQYFAEVTPFQITVFNAVTVYATYFASVATAAFYFHFIKLPNTNRIIAAMFALGVPLSIAHTQFGASNLVFYIPTTILIFAVAVLSLRDFWRHRNIEHGAISVAMLIAPFFSLYDVTLANGHAGWDGNGFYLAVFGGFTYSLAFLISFGKRALDAFGDLAAANANLERRIAETRAELAASEAARQELVVGQALAGERERLMQEMHDGIGSNLITALAVARQQNQPQATIKTLGRALSDLKITVDSLEPVEGDLVALIGNLRHRMAGDLRDAGVTCRWEVEPCGPLTWLDATNALHVLRIFQEAIGNVLTHSGATEVRIGCREQTVGDVAGIAAYVADNGRGFDPAGELPGKGLTNIRARARSLHGVLSSASEPAKGTVITLWLPYERQA